ncbi:MAG TPA: hypothetical protein VNW06_08195 [Cytophagaceae bacterium]|nr:hypothetical protein [Cytophagaceae bacterium]
MKTQGQILMILCFSLAFTFAKLNDKEQYLVYKGIATDLKSDKFYYTEEHKEIIEQSVLKRTSIQYKDGEGIVIAGKKIDYSADKIRPSFEQNDYRDGCVEGVSFSNNKLILKCKKNKSEVLKTKSMDIPEDLVVDGGFNYYIKGNWGKLTEGKTLVFNFAVPSQLDYYAFRLYKESVEKDAIVFRMEPDNFIIRRLVSPIRVTYNTTSKRILKYEGLSNINDKVGKSYTVKIMYPEVGP